MAMKTLMRPRHPRPCGGRVPRARRVGVEHLLERRERARRDLLERLLDQRGDVEEADAAVQERARRPPRWRRSARTARCRRPRRPARARRQAAERVEVGRLEVER